MIITLTNLGKSTISIDGLQVNLGAYEIKTVATDGDVKKSTAKELDALVKKGYITYSTTEDTSIPDDFEDAQISMLHSFIKTKMIDAPNVSGGGTTVTVGFSLVNTSGNPVGIATPLEFAVFNDQHGTTPATSATLNTASKGTILGGAGTSALKVVTNAGGEFACTLTDAVDETVWLGCAQSFMSPALVCLSKDSVTFSA